MEEINLLAMCIGLLNTGRGRGTDSFIHKGTKEIVIFAMFLSAYTITHSYILSVLYFIPMLLWWWGPGGPGNFQPFLTKFFPYEYWEFLIPYVFSMILGGIFLLCQ